MNRFLSTKELKAEFLKIERRIMGGSPKETEMAKEKSTALTTLGLNTKEIGPSLIEEAKEQERKRAQEMVVKGVQALLADCERLRNEIKVKQEQLRTQERRIEAINEGAFTIKFNFEYGAPALVYNDEELRRL